jgi:hypothetical protein
MIVLTTIATTNEYDEDAHGDEDDDDNSGEDDDCNGNEDNDGNDGENDDGNPRDDTTQFEQLLAEVRANSEGENSKPVRIFTLAYGSEADPTELRQIAEASNATAYRASDATTIDQVFQAVVSNF